MSPLPASAHSPSPSVDANGAGAQHSSNLRRLALGALGVVYGDIGTSPLYAVRECFHGGKLMEPTRANVLGILSLIFWSLTIIISVKYTLYVLRADNKGEGGILALMALASAKLRGKRAFSALILLGVFGSALLYGDGVITPAISVLSAIEGLRVAAPQFGRLVIPITIAILVVLFMAQKHGTSRIGAVFGPITLTWFGAIAALGLWKIMRHPEVLLAANPVHAVSFFFDNGRIALTALGSVFLVVTGGEALYADLGHFGRKPIQLAWFTVVFPALSLNYLGQGALLLDDPAAVANPFFHMVPTWALYPMVLLSTLATVIASQALISGVYSLTSQAIMLGFLPRLEVRHTSADERGQIYVPLVNSLLLLATIGLVLGFRSSDALAAAYGIAVTVTMVITTLLTFFLVHYSWGWGILRSAFVTGLFLVPELIFVGANAEKIPDGGWFPLGLGTGLCIVMVTWKRGREVLFDRFKDQLVPLSDFFDIMHVERPARVPGTAVFMTSSHEGTPPALLHNFVHNHAVHQNIVLLTIAYDDQARVSEEQRFQIEPLDLGFQRVVGRYGFMEQPNVPELLKRADVIHSLEHTTFFLGKENLVVTDRPGMAKWRAILFSFMARNAQPATRFFGIPYDRVMEIGMQIGLGVGGRGDAR